MKCAASPIKTALPRVNVLMAFRKFWLYTFTSVAFLHMPLVVHSIFYLGELLLADRLYQWMKGLCAAHHISYGRGMVPIWDTNVKSEK